MIYKSGWILILMAFMVIPLTLGSQVAADSTAAAGMVFTIRNCVNQFDRDKIIPTSVGYQYWFIDKTFIDGRTLKMSVVAPASCTHAPHQHGEDEFFFVLEGTAEFLLDEETARGTAYSSFYCPPNRLHGIRNAGADTLKYLVIKKYPLINQPDAFIDRVREEHQGNGIVPMRVPPD